MTEKQFTKMYPIKNAMFYNVIIYNSDPIKNWSDITNYYYKTEAGAKKFIDRIGAKNYQIRISDIAILDHDIAIMSSGPYISATNGKIEYLRKKS